jgi:hypothetical protein
MQSGQLLGDCCYTTGSVLLAIARKQFCQLSAQLLVAGLRRGPDVPLEEMRCYGAHCSLFDLLEPRFWIVSEQVPTIRELSWLTLTFYRKRPNSAGFWATSFSPRHGCPLQATT